MSAESGRGNMWTLQRLHVWASEAVRRGPCPRPSEYGKSPEWVKPTMWLLYRDVCAHGRFCLITDHSNSKACHTRQSSSIGIPRHWLCALSGSMLAITWRQVWDKFCINRFTLLVWRGINVSSHVTLPNSICAVSGCFFFFQNDGLPDAFIKITCSALHM